MSTDVFSFLPLDSVRLNLMIESKSTNNILKTYRLIIDDEECNLSMPGSTKQFSVEVRLELIYCLNKMRIFVLTSYLEERNLMN